VSAAAWLPAQAAGAANSPTFRDCAFAAGIDPDFVQLSGATVGTGGALSVSAGQSAVTVEASESSDPGDNLGHDTLSVTVTGTGVAPMTVSGQGTGHVTLSVPLSGVAAGGQYTLSWSATFDNAFHSCPGGMTPQNPTANPFVLSVVASTPPPVTLAVTKVRESHRKWRTKQGTTFRVGLSAPARVKLAFRQVLPSGRTVSRGSITRQGVSGTNSVHFKGRVASGSLLGPGRYVAVITAIDSSGNKSKPKRIAFTILH
jgi:hypothetical protein